MKYVKDFFGGLLVWSLIEVAVWIALFLVIVSSLWFFDKLGIKDGGTQAVVFTGVVAAALIAVWKIKERGR